MQKDNITKHKEYQKLARCVYKEHKNKCPKDWIELNHFENRNSGFYATAFTKNNERALSFVIAYNSIIRLKISYYLPLS